ncbi:MAG: hypothetical protein C4289_04035 [Chloroflexota bacterium]
MYTLLQFGVSVGQRRAAVQERVRSQLVRYVTVPTHEAMRRPMRRGLCTRRGLFQSLALLATFGAACTQTERPAASRPALPDIILATTTSTQDTGLLDVLIPVFQRATGYRVKTIAVGSGQALELGRRGEADALLVHAPEEERRFMEEGRGLARLLVMYNDFVIVGPPDDPAHLRGAASTVEALARIAGAQAVWVSRGDQSGTHLLERRLWEQAGVVPQGSPGTSRAAPACWRRS